MSRLYDVSYCALRQTCKLKIRFTEKRMFQEEKTEMDFDEIVEDDSTKKVAALAFVSSDPHSVDRANGQYNCLSKISCSVR
jgi:hypothetical protein